MPTDLHYLAILPEIITAATGIAIMLLDPFTAPQHKGRLGWLGVAGLLAAGVAGAAQSGRTMTAFGGMVQLDSYSVFFRWLFFGVSIGTILISLQYLKREGVHHSEFYALVLFATTGMSFMAASVDLILMFIGLETVAISTYVLAGFKRSDPRSNESAVKYFILGAFSTAVLLYGIAFLYGQTGSTRFDRVAEALSAQGPSAFFLVGLALLLVGFGFKVAMAPFHVWTPDVYEGAPSPVTAFLAVGPKAAGFAALVRVLYSALPDMENHWGDVLGLVAVLTMTVGNVAAITQSNIKRLLAYSSVAHAGYLLVGLVARNELGISAVLYYAVVYALMNLGAFTVVVIWSGAGETRVHLSDYAGIGFRYPFLTGCLSLFLLSLIGIPATGGFMGKVFLFAAAVQSHHVGLVVIAVLNSAVSAYYYLRIIVIMYMQEPAAQVPSVEIPVPAAVALVLAALGTLLTGLYPSALLDLASRSVLAVR
ncbi:MAG: NADH-quinone oxidoreductase subunit N [Acidobacteria bacterium]|nr:NADH-quinone oxidoreductase subunit N [Acidobacteriota bacterium]